MEWGASGDNWWQNGTQIQFLSGKTVILPLAFHCVSDQAAGCWTGLCLYSFLNNIHGHLHVSAGARMDLSICPM